MENDDSILPQDPSVISSPTTNAQKEEKGGGSSGKRAKSSHACDLCKKKKVKCDGQYPCARCLKTNLSCTFNQHKLKRVSSRLYMNTHEQRLRALEKALDCLQVESSSQHHHPKQQQQQQQYNPMTSAAMETTLQTSLAKFNTSSIGQPYYASDWNARLDRLPATFDKMTLLDNEPRKPDAFALPAMGLHHDLLATYFTHVHPYFPMIHKASFVHHIHDTSPLLLNAMYAVAQQWVSIDSAAVGSTQAPPGLKYYQDAISLVELYTDAPRLSTIQGLLLIIKYNELVQRPGFFHRTRFYFDLVVRMCKDLGLPRALPSTCQVHPVLAEQRRRIFWAAYVYDLLMSTELGTPALFSPDECTVDFPSLMDDERNIREQHDTVLYFHWMTMVAKAQGVVLHYLRTKYNNNTDDDDSRSPNKKDRYAHLHSLHQHMMALRAELQLWQEPARGRVNFLFLAYHFTNILLYRSIAREFANHAKDTSNELATLFGMNHDGIKAFLLDEANAIVMIVDQLLKDHTVACLHYSFRGVQQIIHYLTAARTVHCIYQQDDNDRTKDMIRQLIPLTPVVEMQSMGPASTVGSTTTYQKQQKHVDGQLQSEARTTNLAYSPLSAMESSGGEKRTSSHRLQLPPSPTASPSPSPSITNGIPASQQLNDIPLVQPVLPPTSSIPRRHSTQQGTIDPSMEALQHTRPPLLLDTSTLSLLYQPSPDSSSSPITATPSLGSALSSAASTSTLVSTPSEGSGVPSTSAYRSLHLRRSHKQLRNLTTSSLPHRLSSSSSDLRSNGSIPHYQHHPYMAASVTYSVAQSPTTLTKSDHNISTTTLNPALLHQQHTPRRHTVSSSGQSSPSTSSLPSSPLHRMTLSDDPWIQASCPRPQQQFPIPPPPLPQQPTLVSYSPQQPLLPPSSVDQHDVDEHGSDDDVSKVPSTILPLGDGLMMMDLLQQPIDSPWEPPHPK